MRSLEYLHMQGIIKIGSRINLARSFGRFPTSVKTSNAAQMHTDNDWKLVIP